MGRVSLPFLNRTGTSMFWNSLWDNIHNFSFVFFEDIFIRISINYLFSDLLSDKYILFFKKWRFSFINNNKNNLKTIYIFNRTKFLKSLVKYKLFSFFSKVWIWRYQSWIIIYNFIYLSSLSFPKNLENQHNFDIFFSYYFNNIKLKYDYNFSRNYFSKKFFF